MNSMQFNRGTTALAAFREGIKVGHVIDEVDLVLFDQGFSMINPAPVSKYGIMIVDFECTCSDNDAFPRSEMEIIQIGAVVVDNDGVVVATFDRFIKPILHPKLTDFCVQLTGITQEQVDSAKGAVEVFKEFDAFFVSYSHVHGNRWGSWGGFDMTQLSRDLIRHNIESTNLVGSARHYNLKVEWAQYLRVRPMGLGRALKVENMQFNGRAHNGLDDALNIARLSGVKRFIKSIK